MNRSQNRECVTGALTILMHPDFTIIGHIGTNRENRSQNRECVTGALGSKGLLLLLLFFHYLNVRRNRCTVL